MTAKHHFPKAAAVAGHVSPCLSAEPSCTFSLSPFPCSGQQQHRASPMAPGQWVSVLQAGRASPISRASHFQLQAHAHPGRSCSLCDAVLCIPNPAIPPSLSLCKSCDFRDQLGRFRNIPSAYFLASSSGCNQTHHFKDMHGILWWFTYFFAATSNINTQKQWWNLAMI